MVDLMNDWKLDVYDGGYMVSNRTTSNFDKKTGKEKVNLSNPSYFTTLSNALSYVYGQLVKEKIGSHRKDIDFAKLVDDVKETFEAFEKVVEPLKKLEKYGFVKESK